MCALSNGDIFNDLIRFVKVTACFEVEYLISLRDKLLQNTNLKPYPVYRMIPLSMTMIDI